MYKEDLKKLIIDNLEALKEQYGLITCSSNVRHGVTEVTIHIKEFVIARYYHTAENLCISNFFYSSQFMELPEEYNEKYAKKFIDIIDTQIKNYNEALISTKANNIARTMETLDNILKE